MKLVSDTIIYLVGELISKSLPFILIPVFSRLFTMEDFANYTLFYSLYLLFFYLLIFCQDGSISRYFFRYGNYAQFNLIVLGHLLLFFLAFLIGLVIIFSGFKTQEVIWVLFAAISNSIFMIQLRMRHCRFQSKQYVIAQVASALGVLLLTLYLAMVLMIGPTSLFISITIIYTLVSLVLANELLKNSIVIKKLKKSNSKRLFVYLISFGFAGVIHQLSFFSKGHVDRFFIYSNFASEEVAVYGAGTQIATILSVIFMAINKGLNPYAYKEMKDKRINKLEILRYTKLSVIFVPLPGILCFFIPHEIFTFLLGQGFGQSKLFTMLFIISISFTLPYLIMVTFLFFHGKHSLVAIISMLTATMHIFLVYIFVTFNDIKLVPFASIIINLCMCIFLWIYLRFYYEKQTNA